MSSKRKHTLDKQTAARLLEEYSKGKIELSPSQRALFELIAHGKNPSRLQNPRMVEIAPRIDYIGYSFPHGAKHGDCDAECKGAGHRYHHDFEEEFPLLWDTATGRLLV